MAEGGDISGLAAQVGGADSDTVVNPAAGLLGPGESIATMLVNTNDAFSGMDSQSLDGLDVGQSASYMLPAYDAGTESNSENADSIPGPAAGGEGFNAARDDSDFVRIHPGVVSAQDGLGSSALDGSHRWDNPVVKLTVARTG